MSAMKLVLILAIAGACTKNTATATAPLITDPIPMTERSATPQVGSMLAAYERVRALLAADELKGIADAAREIAVAATTAGESSSTKHYKEIASSATTLGAAADLKAARAAFGEVSRHVIALLASDPALARGQHVFECPMVAGYKKWVQPSENLENPYMGKRMLVCGGESTWN